jgi:adenylate cyclase
MMSDQPLDVLEDPELLARFQIWPEEVYRDLLAIEAGKLDQAAFRERYVHRKAILVLDITGFTRAGIEAGEVNAFLRLLNVHKVCDPIMRRRGASLIRAFADDVVALFDDPGAALDAAFEIHARVPRFTGNREPWMESSCCIGIGFGEVFAIGPNLAMGREMNSASKLGEDIATANETLLTESAYRMLEHRTDVFFEKQTDARVPFGYLRATPN